MRTLSLCCVSCYFPAFAFSEACGYAASLGQRKRVAHIPTVGTETARPVDMPLRLDNANALPTYPQ
jgi:hypothetical protein